MKAIDTQTKAVTSYPNESRLPIPSFFLGLLLSSLCSLLLLLSDERFGWQLLTVTSFSAAVASTDMIDALRGKRELFSPRSIVSILMLNSVYIAPVLHIGLGAYPMNVPLPTNMNEAMTNLAMLQLLGHAVYFVAIRVPRGRNKEVQEGIKSRESTEYVKRLKNWVLVLGLVSLLLFLYTIILAGGPQSWLNTQLNYRDSLTASGAILSLAEAFPTLFFIAYLLQLKESDLTRAQLRNRLLIALLLLVTVTFLTSGLRGSRANLVWPTLSGMIMIHLMFYRIRGRLVAILAILGLLFAGVYDVYKKAGTEGIEQLQSGSLDDSTYSFGLENLILADFSRAGVQSILFDRWNNGAFEPYMGTTYIGDAIQFIPGAEPVDKIPNKRVAATEILYGEGSSLTRSNLSSRIYGLQGEALINFGTFGAVMVFVPYAFFMRRTDIAFTQAADYGSLRLSIFVSLLIPAIALLFLSDLDNVLNNLTSRMILPLIASVIATTLTSVSSRKLEKPIRKHFQ